MAAQRAPFARREVLAVAGLVGALLLVLSGRYGYHRDELYFVEAGKHLAWGYPDQPPLVPLLARLADLVAPGSLVVLRLPATLSAATIVVLAALIARELGATRDGQVLAAAATGLCGVVLATGHLLSTTTIALLGWTTLTLLLTRILTGRTSTRSWVLAGVVAGLTCQANPLVASFLLVLAVSLVAAGRTDVLRTRGPYLAGAIAVALAAPYLGWQLAHGLPQLDVAREIADGSSGTSGSRLSFLPMQLLIVGPWLAPIWITGLVRLSRDPALRVLAVCYLGLCLLFLVGAGKPYYLAGLYPLLLAAGAQPVLDRFRTRVVPGLLLALSLPVVAIVLPVLPVRDVNAVLPMNYDAGETVGWPDLVTQVAAAYRQLPVGTVIVTGNYGQAGAIDRYGVDHGLPGAYSGHNGYAAWGPPPATASSVLAVGIDPAVLRRACTSVEPAGTLRNRWGVDNDEDGTALSHCQGLRSSWRDLWPDFTHLS